MPLRPRHKPCAAVLLALASLGLYACAGDGPSPTPTPGHDTATLGTIGARVSLLLLAEPWLRTPVDPDAPPDPEADPPRVLPRRLIEAFAAALDRPENQTEGPWAFARDRLRRAGFLPVVVRRDELESLQTSLDGRPAGPALTLAQSPRWTSIAVGPDLRDPTAVRVHDGLLSLGGGRLRLLVRCFVAPWGESSDGSVPAALRVDAVPQHLAPPERGSEFAAALSSSVARVRTIEDEGPLLTSLASEWLLGPGEVLLLVPLAPDERGVPNAARRTGDAGPVPPDAEIGPAGDPRVEFSMGPSPPRPKTVAEWILSDASDLSDATRRLIVVIDPVLPLEFRLLPPGP
jgi:hypothetical protein